MFARILRKYTKLPILNCLDDYSIAGMDTGYTIADLFRLGILQAFWPDQPEALSMLAQPVRLV
jgi:hypothetical protein